MNTKLRPGWFSKIPAQRRAPTWTGVIAMVLAAGCSTGTDPSTSSVGGGGAGGTGGGVSNTAADAGSVTTTAGSADSTATEGTSTTGGVTTGAGGTGASGDVTTSAGGTITSGGATTSAGGATTGGATTGGATTGGATTSAGAASTTGGANTSGATTTGGVGGGGGLVPAQGALLGVFTPAQSQAELQATESQIGRSWAIHLGYFDWSFDYAAFAQADIAAGRIPYITVEPWDVTLDAIASGSQDSIIQSRAAGVKSLSGKIMLRFAHEMNGDWYPWGGAENGADASASAKYVAAYRHIHDLFAAAGVANVVWVFCPNVDSVPADSWNHWANYYPGDAYVDWMCYDAYNWSTDTFASMTSRIYDELAAKNKPILLGETSTQDVEKANWINQIVPAMQTQFPMLRALVWFHVNKEEDWRYDSTADSFAAFVNMATDPYFNP
jgi:hypothetical protein